MNLQGNTVTHFFLEGAQSALKTAQQYEIKLAILKEGSPSCGSKRIYDGSFSGKIQPGKGLAAALLERHAIRVFNEAEIKLVAAYLKQLE